MLLREPTTTTGHTGKPGLLGLKARVSGLLRLLEGRSLAREACRLGLESWEACLLWLLERWVLAGEAGLHGVLVPCLALALSPLRHRERNYEEICVIMREMVGTVIAEVRNRPRARNDEWVVFGRRFNSEVYSRAERVFFFLPRRPRRALRFLNLI